MALHDALLMTPADLESLGGLPNASLRAGTAMMLRALASLRQASLLGPQAMLETAAPIVAGLAGCGQAAFIVPSRSSWRILAGAESGGGLSRLVHQLGKETREWTGGHPGERPGPPLIRPPPRGPGPAPTPRAHPAPAGGTGGPP